MRRVPPADGWVRSSCRLLRSQRVSQDWRFGRVRPWLPVVLRLAFLAPLAACDALAEGPPRRVQPRIHGTDRQPKAGGDRVARLSLELEQDEDRAMAWLHPVERGLQAPRALPGRQAFDGAALSPAHRRRARGPRAIAPLEMRRQEPVLHQILDVRAAGALSVEKRGHEPRVKVE